IKDHRIFLWDMGWQYWTRFIAVSQLTSTLLSQQWVIAFIWLLLLVIVEWRWGPWIMLAQWALLFWSHGWLDAAVIAHALVMLSLVIKHESNQKRKLYITLTVVLSLLTMTITEYRAPSSATNRPQIELMTTEEKRYVWAEQEHQLTVVNFFATWCPPCHAEMPHLQQFAKKLPDEAALIGINLTARDNGLNELH